MSQMLHYPHPVPAMWLDLAHVIAGAEMHHGATSSRHAYTDEIAPVPKADQAVSAGKAGTLAALHRFAWSFATALACLAVPALRS